MNKIKAWLVELLREDNGSDVCIIKVMAIVAFFTVVGYGIYHGANIMEFAQSVSLALGAAGGSITVKNYSTK